MKGVIIGLSFFFTLGVNVADAQRSNMHQYNLNNLYTGESIDVFDLRKSEVKGSTYWEDEWYKAAIQLNSGAKVDDYPIKYDLLNWQLELYTPLDIKILPGNMVKEFYIDKGAKRYHFVNANHYFRPEDRHFGFFELLVEGKYSLLIGMETEVLQPNYVPALDAGERNPKLIKKERYYLFDGKKMSPLPKNKRERAKIFARKIPGSRSYIQLHKLNLKRKKDLVELIGFCNTL